jgi:hypothetical protein
MRQKRGERREKKCLWNVGADGRETRGEKNLEKIK